VLTGRDAAPEIIAVADTVTEQGSETPIGVVTALVGAPMFIFVLRSRRVPT